MVKLSRMGVLAAALMALVFSPAQGQERGTPGQFEYYVLSLSWSPTWCSTRAGLNDQDQCAPGRRLGFVVHGLWPQYAKGGYPQECATPGDLPKSVVDQALAIMPSRDLIAHEWKRHGTCDGTSAQDYFAKVAKAREKLVIPPAFQNPVQPRLIPTDQVEPLFQASNPGLSDSSFNLICRGRHGAEIRVCMDKNLNFTDCGKGVRDRCSSGEVLFPAGR